MGQHPDEFPHLQSQHPCGTYLWVCSEDVVHFTVAWHHSEGSVLVIVIISEGGGGFMGLKFEEGIWAGDSDWVVFCRLG